MKQKVNNKYYDGLGDHWYTANDDPIAILRAESIVKNPWVGNTIYDNFETENLKIADIGCGAGFLTNYLAKRYKHVHGLDASKSSLDVARKMDKSGSVKYMFGDAYSLPYEEKSMDVVCAMDFLEHVEKPEAVVKECGRVLKPGGLFFYHTFNRNILSWLIVIKFMEWFVPNTPKNLHVLHLFIKPKELYRMFESHDLTNVSTHGIAPRFDLKFFQSILHREVLDGFRFQIGGPTLLGYIGFARKAP